MVRSYEAKAEHQLGMRVAEIWTETVLTSCHTAALLGMLKRLRAATHS